jgi:hypothetical protein
MADRIGYAQPRCARPERGREERPQRSRIRACRILRDVQHLQPFANGEPNRVLGGLLQKFERPPFRVPPDRTRPDKCAAFDRNPGPLGNLGDRSDIGRHRARCAVRPDFQTELANRPRQTLDVGGDLRSGSRQADVCGVDSERVHALKDVDLLVDGGRPHGRRLQPVSQRLVVQHGDSARTGAVRVPIMDQRVRDNHNTSQTGNLKSEV